MSLSLLSPLPLILVAGVENFSNDIHDYSESGEEFTTGLRHKRSWLLRTERVVILIDIDPEILTSWSQNQTATSPVVMRLEMIKKGITD